MRVSANTMTSLSVLSAQEDPEVEGGAVETAFDLVLAIVGVLVVSTDVNSVPVAVSFPVDVVLGDAAEDVADDELEEIEFEDVGVVPLRPVVSAGGVDLMECEELVTAVFEVTTEIGTELVLPTVT